MPIKQHGFYLLFAASFCIATASIASKIGLQQGVPVLTLVISRTTIAAVLLWVLLWIWRPES